MHQHDRVQSVGSPLNWYSGNIVGNKLADVIAFIEELEAEFELVGRDFYGVPLWPAVRMDLFVQLATRLGSYGSAQIQYGAPRSKWSSLRWLRSNPYLQRERVKFVVVGASRIARHEGKDIDTYTNHLLGELPADASEYVCTAGAPEKMRFPEGLAACDGQPIFALYRIRRKLWSMRLSRDNVGLRIANDITREVNSRLTLRYGFSVELDQIVNRTAGHYLAQRDAWKSFFRIRQPKVVIMGDQCYGNEGQIRAAHEVGAKVVEIQHGVIFPGHPAYHFKGRPVVEDRPDLFLLFGEGWGRGMAFPRNMRTGLIGFGPIRKAQKKLVSEAFPRTRQVAVLSSHPFCADLLVDAVRRVLEADPLNRVVIRPHPTDPFVYRSAFDQATHRQIYFSSPAEPIDELLVRSEYVVTGPSAVAFEGLALGCKVVCLQSDFSQLQRELLESTNIRTAISVDQIPLQMREARVQSDTDEIFSFETEDLCTLISKRLNYDA